MSQGVSALSPNVQFGALCSPLVQAKWKQSVRQTACPPTPFFHRGPCRRHCSWPHRHTLSFTQTHTHTLTHCHLLWGALWPPKHSPPPTPLSLTCSSAHPLCLHQTHINTVIGHPHVPVNLLMRRHGSCRVPLPPRCWPTCLRVSFTLAHANCLMDCLT